MVQLKLYGTGTSGYQYLKKSIENFIDFNHIDAKIEEVNDVSRFIADNINSVPSIIINGDTPIEISNDGDFKKSINKIYHRIAHIYGQRLTRKILVPTDFSSSAATALHFAKIFSKNKYFTLHLLHVHHPAYIEVAKHPLEAEHIIEDKVHKLEMTASNAELDFIGDLSTTIPIEPIFQEGLAGDVIIDLSQDYEYIVMGSHGASNLFDNLLGSVSHTVACHAKCPVILVPPMVEFYKLNRIGLVQDETDFPLIDQLKMSFPNVKLIHFTNTQVNTVEGVEYLNMESIENYINFEDMLFITTSSLYQKSRSLTEHNLYESLFHRMQIKGRPLMVCPVRK